MTQFIQLEFRATFTNKDDRDTARLALNGQEVFWDGRSVGALACSHNTDDEVLGLCLFINVDKTPLAP